MLYSARALRLRWIPMVMRSFRRDDGGQITPRQSFDSQLTGKTGQLDAWRVVKEMLSR